jgi:hypothetical protein
MAPVTGSVVEDRATVGMPRQRRASVRRLPEPAALSAPISTAESSRAEPQPDRVREPAIHRGVHGCAELVLRLVLEVVSGRRPAVQLHGMVTRRVLRYVAAEANRPATHGHALRRLPGRAATGTTAPAAGAGLRALRICQPTDEAAEVSAVWRQQGRYRALAARFELVYPAEREPQWRCTALRLG